MRPHCAVASIHARKAAYSSSITVLIDERARRIGAGDPLQHDAGLRIVERDQAAIHQARHGLTRRLLHEHIARSTPDRWHVLQVLGLSVGSNGAIRFSNSFTGPVDGTSTIRWWGRPGPLVASVVAGPDVVAAVVPPVTAPPDGTRRAHRR